MRRSFPLLIASMLLSAAPAVAARLPPEAQLAKALSGRVAGKPVDCLTLRDIRSSRIFDRTAILYETSGGKLYLNRPDQGLESLRRDNIMVTDTHSSQLCSIDTVRMVDNSTRSFSGVLFLGEFVPYVRAAQ